MSSDGVTARAPKLSIDTILESWCNMKAYDAHREKPATGERKSSQFGRVAIRSYPSYTQSSYTVYVDGSSACRRKSIDCRQGPSSCERRYFWAIEVHYRSVQCVNGNDKLGVVVVVAVGNAWQTVVDIYNKMLVSSVCSPSGVEQGSSRAPIGPVTPDDRLADC